MEHQDLITHQRRVSSVEIVATLVMVMYMIPFDLQQFPKANPNY